MSLATVSRRSFLTATAAFLAAPAIVRASSLMPVKAWEDEVWTLKGNHTISREDFQTAWKFMVENQIPIQDQYIIVHPSWPKLLANHGLTVDDVLSGPWLESSALPAT